MGKVDTTGRGRERLLTSNCPARLDAHRACQSMPITWHPRAPSRAHLVGKIVAPWAGYFLAEIVSILRCPTTRTGGSKTARKCSKLLTELDISP